MSTFRYRRAVAHTASTGSRTVIRAAGTKPVIRYVRGIDVAVRGMSGSASLSGPSDPDRHELERITAAAVKKVMRTR